MRFQIKMTLPVSVDVGRNGELLDARCAIDPAQILQRLKEDADKVAALKKARAEKDRPRLDEGLVRVQSNLSDIRYARLLKVTKHHFVLEGFNGTVQKFSRRNGFDIHRGSYTVGACIHPHDFESLNKEHGRG